MEIKNCSGDISMPPVDCAKLDIKEFTFDTFIEDSTNRFAVVACKEFFSALPYDIKILWLYGPIGRGKTHLLRATENQFKTKHSICSLNAKELGEEYLSFIFKRKTRLNEIEEVQLLIIDDVDYLLNKTTTQEEIAKLILKKVSNGLKVLLASNCYPHELEVLYKLIFGEALFADTGFTAKEKRIEMVTNFLENSCVKIENEALMLLTETELTIPLFIRTLRKIEEYYQRHKALIDKSMVKEFIDKAIKFYDSL